MTPRRALPALALLLVSTGAALPAPAAEECSAWMTAWQDESPSRAKRAALEESARERAIDDLARRAFSVVLREDFLEEIRRVRSGGPGSRDGYSADLLMIDVARSFYEVDAELRGGRTETQGGANRRTVRYCVGSERLERARANVLARRAEFVETVRKRFAELEEAIRRKDYGLAGRTLLPDLKNDVSRAVLDVELYTSPNTGLSRRFSDWLRDWSELVGHEREYAVYSCDRAQDAVRRGHLAEADLFVKEGLRVDAHEVACLRARDRIGQLRQERTGVLAVARAAAADGKFSRASELLARARAIDTDDRTSLEEAQRDVQAARTEFLRRNHSFRLGLAVGLGGLGVDRDATAAVLLPPGVGTSSDPVLLADLQVRLGRHVFLFGEFGRSASFYDSTAGSSTELYRAIHWAGGLGWKSVARGGRIARWEISGGVLSQTVDVSAAPGRPSESRTGAVARAGLDVGHLYLFAQRTFLFQDEAMPGTAVRWADQYLGGIGLWLH